MKYNWSIHRLTPEDLEKAKAFLLEQGYSHDVDTDTNREVEGISVFHDFSTFGFRSDHFFTTDRKHGYEKHDPSTFDNLVKEFRSKRGLNLACEVGIIP